MKTLNQLLAAALLGAIAVPASAAQFDFYKLKSPVGGSDFTPSGPSFNCTGGDKCSSDVDAGSFGGVLTYSDAGIALDASGSFTGGIASAVQDHENGWSATTGAGLGVYHLSGVTSDDNITSGETLTITFDQVVTLTSIGLRSEGHNYTSWGAGKTFLLDGVSTLLPQNVGSIAVNMTGQVFSFAYGGTNADQFYLASLTAAPVPEPESWALALAGLAAIGVTLRRRAKAG